MSTITITATKLAEILGLDSTQGIYDISLNAWDSSECVINISVGPRCGLAAAGLEN